MKIIKNVLNTEERDIKNEMVWTGVHMGSGPRIQNKTEDMTLPK